MFSWASILQGSAGGVAPQRKAGQPSQGTGKPGSQRPGAIAEAEATAEATAAEKRSERRRARWATTAEGRESARRLYLRRLSQQRATRRARPSRELAASWSL